MILKLHPYRTVKLEIKGPDRQATIGLRDHYNGKPEHSLSLEIIISEKYNQSESTK
jgi:hypothetical protein